MLAQARRVDVADSAFSYAGRDDEVERPFQPHQLDRRVRQRFGLLERRNRRVRIGGRILPGLDRGFDKSAHRVRMLLGKGGGGEHHVGVEVDAVVAQHDDVDVVALDAEPEQRGDRRHHPGGGEINVAAHEHRLTDLRLHVRPLHARGIDPVHAREDVEQAIGGVNRRGAAFAAHEVRGLLDPGLLERDQAQRRLVVDQEDGDQLASRVLCVELDHGAEIAETDIVRAARHLGDRVRSAAAGIEGREVDLLRGVVTALAAEHERRLLPLQQEVQDEADIGGLGRRGRDRAQRCQQSMTVATIVLPMRMVAPGVPCMQTSREGRTAPADTRLPCDPRIIEIGAAVERD